MPDGASVAAPRVCDVPIGHLHFIWPQARQFVVAANDRAGGGRYLPSDIFALLLAGKARLWVSWDASRRRVEAAIITQIIEFPRLKELHIWLVGGEHRGQWFDEAEAMIEAFARAEGCSKIASSGRLGWLRVIGPDWHQTGATWERELA